jgi:hypothetical protein
MRQAKIDKPRRCVRCGLVIVTTAAGIRAHAEGCRAAAELSAVVDRLNRRAERVAAPITRAS